MQLSRTRLLQDTIQRYLRRQAWSNLDRLIDKTRPEEIALVMTGLSEPAQHIVFGRLKQPVRQAAVIVSMQPPFGKRVLEELGPDAAAAILREMAQDDMADIIGDLEPEHAKRVLESIDGSDEVEDLMSYPDDTAGGIMLPEFVSLSADATAEEALIKLRESSSEDVEMIYYNYVVNEHGHLVGVLSLRKLVTAPAHQRIREIMETDVLSVSTETDQEAVAQLVSDYGLLAVPVVDESNRILGLVTVDDVIEVIHEEANEDFMKMAGAGTYLSGDERVSKHVAIRFPWLLASCGGGLIAAVVMGHYEETLRAHHFLALFLPVILGMAGNVGTQSATVTVRGIAMGSITGERRWAAIKKEFLISLSLGVLYGTLIALVSYFFADHKYYAIAIGASIAIGMVTASTIGTTIPILLSRLNIDPAVATGPIVTTSVDFFGVMTYFGIATWLAATFMGGG